jgi:WXG100 family type VII secretion target
MGKAQVDAGELRRFARDLTRFRQELQMLMTSLQSKLRNLQKTWRDQQQQRFEEEFEQTFKALRKFLDASEQHIVFLQQRAGHIEDYLQR